jgi:hypothetical protein
MTAPAIGGAAIALATALVWLLRPQPEAGSGPDSPTEPLTPPVESATELSTEPIFAEKSTADAQPSAVDPVASAARSPLPGEAPAAPMTQFLSDRQSNVIIGRTGPRGPLAPELVAGEQEFAREPIDAAWAPGAEAELLAKFAQMPGLKLIDLQAECRSTMCRLQMTQPRTAPGEHSGTSFNALLSSVGMQPRWIMAVVDGPFGGSAPLKSIAYLWREEVAPAAQRAQEIYALDFDETD